MRGRISEDGGGCRQLEARREPSSNNNNNIIMYCIYVYMYTCIYEYIYVHVHVHVHVCVCVYNLPFHANDRQRRLPMRVNRIQHLTWRATQNLAW
jgi:hypothetical protein